MSGCLCSRYLAPLETRADVKERCGHTEAIRSTLEPLVGTTDSWMRLYRCTRCGQLWQSNWLTGEIYPDRLVFDDFETLTEYLETKARRGDAFLIRDFGAVCRADNALVNAKYPNAAGLVPTRGAY
jgi:hypothetical protein